MAFQFTPRVEAPMCPNPDCHEEWHGLPRERWYFGKLRRCPGSHLFNQAGERIRER